MSKTRAIGYLRVSTKDQADNGLSIDAQKAKIEAYATLYDIDIVDIVIDAGASASSLNRKGIQSVLDRLGKDADALIVTKLDRLTRSVKDLGLLIDEYFTKYTLLSVTEQLDTRSAGGRLVLNVLMSVAQWEREIISERTKEALDFKRNSGEKLGGSAPFGYRMVNKERVPIPEEQETIKIVRVLHAMGEHSLREISAELYARGLKNRGGGVFSAQSINNIVKGYKDGII